MQLTSTAFENNGQIPPQYTCDGDNINPPLQISDVPEQAQSLALIMDDPDAPVGTWDHWVIFNISPQTENIDENSEPNGTPGQGTRGNTKYSGPCPPDGEHRYIFKLYAIDTQLDLNKGVSKQQVEDAMKDHIIDQTKLIGKYTR